MYASVSIGLNYFPTTFIHKWLLIVFYSWNFFWPIRTEGKDVCCPLIYYSLQQKVNKNYFIFRVLFLIFFKIYFLFLIWLSLCFCFCFFNGNLVPFSKVFFLMWTILLNLLQYCFCFGFWLQGMWNLSSSTRDQTYTTCIGRWTLNHWTKGKSPEFFSMTLNCKQY